ncbi:MAG TPA: carboxymuconolactone decarboxylase family protein [Polyangiaceae bacterium]|nr:carboxymuconolactone decarboxylase family protein [Polyangiaceae bacterium]
MTHRIAPTTPANAPEATKPLLAQMKSALGMIPNLYATAGHSPGTLDAVLRWGAAIDEGGLSRREIEQLHLHVSELNGCAYCVAAHGALAARAGLSAAEAEAARAGLGANERESALLALARRVVRTGGAQAGTELARAREAGVGDREIVDVLAIVALKAFTNALALVAETEIDFPKARRSPQR